MAALVCDVCGGKLIMGTGGTAVCDSCGIEYSTDRMKEKIQEIKGVVRVDNSHMVENYLKMAKSAIDAGNNPEAESYCNKIIEIEPTNYKAWLMKGEAAAWQSSLQNSRIDEGVSSFIKAINNAPDEEKDDVVEEAKDQIVNLSVAMISLRTERFAKWPDEEETNGFVGDIVSICSTVVTFLTQTGAVIPLSEIMAPAAAKIDQAVVQAWEKVILPDYQGDPNDSDDRANKYEWQRFIERIDYCIKLLEQAVVLCDDDDEEDIQRYKNLIYLQNQAIDSCSWDYNITEWGYKSWYKDWCLTDESKDFRREKICEYEEKNKAIENAIEKKEEEEAQKRFAVYWAEHEDVKVALEAEKRSLEEPLSLLEDKLCNIPEYAEKEKLEEQIKTLTEEKNLSACSKEKRKRQFKKKLIAKILHLKMLLIK